MVSPLNVSSIKCSSSFCFILGDGTKCTQDDFDAINSEDVSYSSFYKACYVCSYFQELQENFVNLIIACVTQQNTLL